MIDNRKLLHGSFVFFFTFLFTARAGGAARAKKTLLYQINKKHNNVILTRVLFSIRRRARFRLAAM